MSYRHYNLEGTGDGEMEGSSLVLEKNDSEDSCGDQEERSSDIVFVIFDILGIYCH